MEGILDIIGIFLYLGPLYQIRLTGHLRQQHHYYKGKDNSHIPCICWGLSVGEDTSWVNHFVR